MRHQKFNGECNMINRIKMFVIIVCGISVLCMAGFSNKSNKDTDKKQFENTETDGIGNPVVYRDYGNSYHLNAGSKWSLLDFDVEEIDYDDMYLCMFDFVTMEETLIQHYTGQKHISYTVSKDGIYDIYMRVQKNGQEDIIDLNSKVEVNYMSGNDAVMEKDSEHNNSIIQLK